MKLKHLLNTIGGVIATIIGLSILSSGLYAVDETEFALEMRFGKIREVHREPGLKVKMPIIDNVPANRQTNHSRRHPTPRGP